MPRRHDDDDDLDDAEFPEPDDGDEDGVDTVSCPHCGAAVYEQAERCPRCENYLSREDAPFRPPWWLVAGVVLCLVIVAGWVLAS